jgi:MFS family permease
MMTSANKCVDAIGLVTSFGGLVTVRVFLGLVEGPMPPCIVCYLSGFYTRKELALRFVSSILSGCFFSINLASRIALFFSATSVCIES